MLPGQYTLLGLLHIFVLQYSGSIISLIVYYVWTSWKWSGGCPKLKCSRKGCFQWWPNERLSKILTLQHHDLPSACFLLQCTCLLLYCPLFLVVMTWLSVVTSPPILAWPGGSLRRSCEDRVGCAEQGHKWQNSWQCVVASRGGCDSIKLSAASSLVGTFNCTCTGFQPVASDSLAVWVWPCRHGYRKPFPLYWLFSTLLKLQVGITGTLKQLLCTTHIMLEVWCPEVSL